VPTQEINTFFMALLSISVLLILLQVNFA